MKRATRKSTGEKKGLELTRRLATYSAAVGAGVALSPQADADIVYSGPSLAFGAFNTQSVTMEGAADVDLGGLAIGATYSSAPSFLSFNAQGVDDFVVVHTAGTTGFIRMLPFGAVVGPATNTPAGAQGVFASSAFTYSGGPTTGGGGGGDWAADGARGYMGFSFTSEFGTNPTLYGWADIERVSASSGILHGWAYDDSGAPMVVGVPEPSGLALLALGAAGVAAFRRRRAEA